MPTEHDASLGHTLCIGCGNVFEENTIVSEVAFMENAKGAAIAEGFALGRDKARVTRHASGPGRRMLSGAASRETTLLNGNRRVEDIGRQVRMSETQIDAGKNAFALAVNHNFTKGRKLTYVAVACLYLICRRQKLPIMLIDFSDILSVNVFLFGHTYLLLCQTLHITDLEPIDPSLYIPRFAMKLEFEDDVNQVIADANRLASRLARDWIVQGRRPAGICAACLFVAARMNGFKRTHREIVMVAKISEATIRKRLTEFANTQSAQLSVEDFRRTWLEETEMPPAYVAGLNKRPLVTDEDEAGRIEGRGDSGDASGPSTATATGTGHIDDEDAFDEELLAEMRNSLEENSHLISQELGGDFKDDPEEDAHLSDLDSDPEISSMLSVTAEEASIRELIWMEEHKDWLLKQSLKLERQKHIQSQSTRPRQPRIKKPRVNLSGATAAEATRNLINMKPAMSKKINWDAIESMLEFDEESLKERARAVTPMVDESVPAVR
ncbi:cyclin-like protein [Gaertneriomyces semiglobifer]|nr:cyclin-like protein [Gaertneriomyces semiglobifer]